MSRKKAKKEKAKKERKIDSSISRRDMLKAGAAAGAATVMAPIMLTSRKASAFQERQLDPQDDPDAIIRPVTEPVLCPAPAPASPPTTPFVDVLPIPLSAIQTSLNPAPTKKANTSRGEAARADHQRWEQFLPKKEFLLEARAATHRFHSDLLPSYVWGFSGRYPAPTIRSNYGDPTIVRFRNSLPAMTTSFGTPSITVHLHNGHTASESDGFAADFFSTGLFKDNHYANAYAGIDAFGGNGDPREAMHTFWFHDHLAGQTAKNNYLGLNGMYLLYDRTDPGHENATTGSLRLPGIYGVTDIPLILTDKRFCAAANGRNEAFQVIGQAPGLGDKWIVNGKIQPFFQVRRRKYRFRILNTGPNKGWNLSLIKPDGTAGVMTVVATDANFLASPAPVTALPIQVAERFDVIINFAEFPVGTRLYLKEAAPQNVGEASPVTLPTGLAIENVLMRFDVVQNSSSVPPDTPAIPSTLTTYPTLPAPNSSFLWTFKLVGGRFLINDLEFDDTVDNPAHVVLKGTTEEWDLRNDVISGIWTHPVHIHFEEFRVQSRQLRTNPSDDPAVVPVYQNVPLTAIEKGRKDVITLNPQERVKIRMQFRDFVGRYLMHCHNMNHEDAFMMVRWDIVDSVAEYNRRRQEIAERRRMKGLPELPERKEVAG